MKPATATTPYQFCPEQPAGMSEQIGDGEATEGTVERDGTTISPVFYLFPGDKAREEMMLNRAIEALLRRPLLPEDLAFVNPNLDTKLVANPFLNVISTQDYETKEMLVRDFFSHSHVRMLDDGTLVYSQQFTKKFGKDFVRGIFEADGVIRRLREEVNASRMVVTELREQHEFLLKQLSELNHLHEDVRETMERLENMRFEFIDEIRRERAGNNDADN